MMALPSRRSQSFRASARKPFPSALAFAAALTVFSCAMPEPPARVALVYGVSNYVETWSGDPYQNPNLSLTDDDARAMASMLRLKGWTVIDRVAASSTDPEANRLASKDQIRADINGLKGSTGQVLFYFSGHGMLVGSEAAICPYDSLTPNQALTSYTINRNELITSIELYSMLEAAGVNNAVIILDTCHSGGFVREGPTVDAVPDIFEPLKKNGTIRYKTFIDATKDALEAYIAYETSGPYVALSAAGIGELSYEARNLGHGIFTFALLEAGNDEQADLDRDGYINTSELYAYASAVVDQIWNAGTSSRVNELGQNPDYHPHLSGTAREYALWAVQ